MDAGQDANWKKPVTEGEILHFSTRMRHLELSVIEKESRWWPMEEGGFGSCFKGIKSQGRKEKKVLGTMVMMISPKSECTRHH